jgi:hypothetical protein
MALKIGRQRMVDETYRRGSMYEEFRLCWEVPGDEGGNATEVGVSGSVPMYGETFDELIEPTYRTADPPSCEVRRRECCESENPLGDLQFSRGVV